MWIRSGQPPVIFGDGSQTRDFTWVEETAVGVVAAAECDALVGEAVNLAHGEPVTIREICDHLLDIMGADGLAPEFTDDRPGDVAHHWADTTKARELMGFEAAVPIREGLERYVSWLAAQADGDVRGEPEIVRKW
jgi:UDP-glucose 4-epimerase